MVFPRAVLDKTVSPAVSSTVGGSFGCFFFFLPPQWESVVQLYSPHWVLWSGSASCCWVPVCYCFVLCFLLFAFNTPGSPPSSGAHWSVKPSETPRLTEPDSFLQAEAGEVAARVFQVKDHPRKSCFYTAGHPLWCGRFCPTGTSTQRVSVYR